MPPGCRLGEVFWAKSWCPPGGVGGNGQGEEHDLLAMADVPATWTQISSSK